MLLCHILYTNYNQFVQLPIVNGYENNYLLINVYHKLEVKQRELKCTEYSI